MRCAAAWGMLCLLAGVSQCEEPPIHGVIDPNQTTVRLSHAFLEAEAADPVVLTVTLVDGYGDPVPNAETTLRLESAYGEPGGVAEDIDAITDEDGTSSFSVWAEAPGIVEAAVDVTTTLESVSLAPVKLYFISPGADEPVDAGVGWNLYSCQGSDPSSGLWAGIREQRPGLVRWILEIDRYERTPDWSGYQEFFDALEEVGATLIVQLWVQQYVLDWALAPECQWICPINPNSCQSCYFLNLSCSYTEQGALEPFIGTLEAEFAARPGIHVIYGAFNEIDLRWALDSSGNAVENYHEPWTLGSVEDGNARWTGGSGERYTYLYEDLRDAADPARLVSSSAIIQYYSHELPESGTYSSYRWLEATAPHIDIIELHRYVPDSMTAQDFVDEAGRLLAAWDANRPEGPPFYFGETGNNSTEGTLEASEAYAMQERHAALMARFPNRYRGMAWHGASAWNQEVPWWALARGDDELDGDLLQAATPPNR